VLAEGNFTWNGDSFAPVALPGVTDPQLQGVSEAGVVWGFRESDSLSFVSDLASTEFIAHPDYDNTFLVGIDGSGRVYGTRSNDPEEPMPGPIQIAVDPGGFFLDGGVFSDLAIPGATNPFVDGVRSDGLVWGQDETLGAFLYDGLSVSVLDPPGDEAFTLIYGVADSGLVAGTRYTDSSHDFLYDGVAFHDWSVPGAAHSSIQGMNEAGVIWGTSTLGAYIATPVPEPGTGPLLALGLAALAARTSRSRAR